jgi:hypothetical protein
MVYGSSKSFPGMKGFVFILYLTLYSRFCSIDLKDGDGGTRMMLTTTTNDMEEVSWLGIPFHLAFHLFPDLYVFWTLHCRDLITKILMI